MKVDYPNPFKAPGQWFKGNLHTHTTASDGVRTSQETVDHYSRNGYDFLSITDHGVLTDPTNLNPQGMTLIPGEEICLGNSQASTNTHIVVVNIRESLPLTDFNKTTDPQEAIDLTAQQGGFTIIAHPYWSGLHISDILRLRGYLGVEIYNTSCDVYRGTGLSSPHVDAIIAAGRRPFIFATDDHHGEPEPMKQSDACGAWIMVKSREKTTQSIAKAIEAGFFYASNGPTIKCVEARPEGIHIETSPVKHITFVSTPSLGARFTAGDKPLTEYTYPGRLGETYVRIEAMDSEGRIAWTNPIFNSGVS
jgi:hypothetical protein